MVNWRDSGQVPGEGMGHLSLLPEHAETQTCHYNPHKGDRVWQQDDGISQNNPGLGHKWVFTVLWCIMGFEIIINLYVFRVLLDVWMIVPENWATDLHIMDENWKKKWSEFSEGLAK